MSLRSRFHVAAILLMATAGCGPRIIRFEVLPHAVCEGTVSTVSWDIKGEPTLTTEPPLTPVAGQRHRYVAASDTVFRLEVKRGPHKPKVAETEVRVFSATENAMEQMAFQVDCQGRNLVATLPRPAEEWDPRLRLGAVSSAGGREIRIDHWDRSATLTTGSPSTSTFQGLPMSGSWRISVPLLERERCDDPGAALPARILLTATVVCGR